MTIGRIVTRRAAVKALGAVTLLPGWSEEGLVAFVEIQRSSWAKEARVAEAAMS